MNILLAAKPCRHPAPQLSTDESSTLLMTLPHWKRDGSGIVRNFKFPDHYQLMAFLNALAWVAHRANHHPEVSYGFNQCCVRFISHDVGGLSENDFICAAKVDILVSL